jgi:hypothetical protein
MYRIRLTTGEEAVFRVVEELSLGIASGVVAPDAEIYHTKSGSWLPIRSHPVYQAALEQRPIALEDPEATQNPASVRPAEPAPVPEVMISPEGIPEIVMSADGVSPEEALTIDVPSEASLLEVSPTDAGPGRSARVPDRMRRSDSLRAEECHPLAIAATGFAAVVVFIALLFPRSAPRSPRRPSPQYRANHPPSRFPLRHPPPPVRSLAHRRPSGRVTGEADARGVGRRRNLAPGSSESRRSTRVHPAAFGHLFLQPSWAADSVGLPGEPSALAYRADPVSIRHRAD